MFFFEGIFVVVIAEDMAPGNLLLFNVANQRIYIGLDGVSRGVDGVVTCKNDQIGLLTIDQ